MFYNRNLYNQNIMKHHFKNRRSQDSKEQPEFHYSHQRNYSKDSLRYQQPQPTRSSFQLVEPMHFNQEIQNITTILNDKYRSLASQPTKTPQSVQRKKYLQIKKKIATAFKQFSHSTHCNLKELFNTRQIFLRDCLDNFAEEIGRQCKEKGQILKYIWNSMTNMIEDLLEHLTKNYMQKEKDDLKSNLDAHRQYQHLLDKKIQLEEQMQKKIAKQEITIKTLISQMRFKRKEIERLYKNQKSVNIQLNDLKNDYLFVQKRCIQQLSSVNGVSQDKIKGLKEEIQSLDKNMSNKIHLKGNKKNNRRIIQQSIKEDSNNDASLRKEIIEIVNTNLNSSENVGYLIDNAIESFDFKVKSHQKQSFQILQKKNEKRLKLEGFSKLQAISSCQTQDMGVYFDYTEKLINKIINNRNTQTCLDFNYKKTMINQHIQTQEQWMHKQDSMKMQHVFSITHYCHQLESTISLKIKNKGLAHKKQKGDIFLRQPHKESKINSQVNSYASINLHQDQKSCNSQQQQLQSIQKELIQENNLKTKDKKTFKLKKTSKARPYHQYIQKNDVQKLKTKGLKTYHQNKVNVNRNSLQQKRFSYDIQGDQAHMAATLKHKKMTIQVKQQLKSKKDEYQQKASLRQELIKFQSKDLGFCNIIKIDQVKKQQIYNFFIKKEHYFTNHEENQQDSDFSEKFEQNQKDEFVSHSKNKQNSSQDKNIRNLSIKLSKNKMVSNIKKQKTAIKTKRQVKNSQNSKEKDLQTKLQILKAIQFKNGDHNEMLLKLCRDRYAKKSEKIMKRIKVRKNMDDSQCLRQKMKFIATDVQLVIKSKSQIKKKHLNNNLQNTYKVIMMTFIKVYEYYEKGILVSNLVNPLFQSLAIYYGNHKHEEVYRKMVHFIASLALAYDNIIFRFFLFFLALDSKSQYSSKVTLIEIQICLKLLQEISRDGKITLNIDTIYTDTQIVKDRLMNILRQQKMPSSLLLLIQNKIVNELNRSNSSQKLNETSQVKLNIYNVILLITKEIIKCKSALTQVLTPIFNIYQEYQRQNVLPIDLLEVLVSLSNEFFSNKMGFEPIVISFKKQTLTTAQFVAFLFENNLVEIQKILGGICSKKLIAMPLNIFKYIKKMINQNLFKGQINRKRYVLLDRLLDKASGQHLPLIQHLKSSLFICEYNQIVSSFLEQMVGKDLLYITMN